MTYSSESLSSITVGGQNAVKVLGRGSVQIDFLLNDGSINEVFLTNVLHVPDFGTNLVSVMALMSKGLSILLTEPTCQICWHDNTTLAEGERVGGLIRLNTIVSLPWVKEAAVHLTKAETNAEEGSARLWHRRLGHISYENLRRLTDMALGVNIGGIHPLDTCETCLKGKQPRTPSH